MKIISFTSIDMYTYEKIYIVKLLPVGLQLC